MNIERKHAATAEFKMADGDAMEFEGYGDLILKGAFTATLREAKRTGVWPAMLLQHGGGFFGDAEGQTPIGIWTDIFEDDRGLVCKGKLAPTDRGEEVYALMKMTPRPAIDGLSIDYRAKEFVQGTKPSEPNRTLKVVDLFEISCVTFPMNGRARLTNVKSDDDRPTIRDAEDALREAGFSRNEAKAILASGFKTLPQRDAGDGGDVPDLAEKIRQVTASLS